MQLFAMYGGAVGSTVASQKEGHKFNPDVSQPLSSCNNLTCFSASPDFLVQHHYHIFFIDTQRHSATRSIYSFYLLLHQLFQSKHPISSALSQHEASVNPAISSLHGSSNFITLYYNSAHQLCRKSVTVHFVSIPQVSC